MLVAIQLPVLRVVIQTTTTHWQDGLDAVFAPLNSHVQGRKRRSLVPPVITLSKENSNVPNVPQEPTAGARTGYLRTVLLAGIVKVAKMNAPLAQQVISVKNPTLHLQSAHQEKLLF